MTGLFDPLPQGAEVLDLDDLIEQAQLTAAESKEAAQGALTFLKAEMAGASTGGVTLSAADLQAIVTMLESYAGLAAAAHDAATAVAIARIGAVR